MNSLYIEDCLITMSKINDEFVDLVVTSPPYDNLRTYNKFIKGNETKYNGYSFDFENVAKELYRIIKKGGVLVWVIGDATKNGSETGTSFRQALYFKECGFNLYDTMIYQKTGTPFPSQVRYNQSFEYMFVFTKGKPNTFNPIMKKNVMAGSVRNTRKYRNSDGEMIPSFNGKAVNEYGIQNNIWLMKNGMNKSTKDKIAFKHPAIFPEELSEKHIISWSKEGDIVYDPFAGSGTTIKSAIKLGRNWIGSEISKEYAEIIEKRIENVERQEHEYITKDKL